MNDVFFHAKAFKEYPAVFRSITLAAPVPPTISNRLKSAPVQNETALGTKKAYIF
jgi:hypothetical protein